MHCKECCCFSWQFVDFFVLVVGATSSDGFLVWWTFSILGYRYDLRFLFFYSFDVNLGFIRACNVRVCICSLICYYDERLSVLCSLIWHRRMLFAVDHRRRLDKLFPATLMYFMTRPDTTQSRYEHSRKQHGEGISVTGRSTTATLPPWTTISATHKLAPISNLIENIRV